MVDGATQGQILRKVILPLSGAGYGRGRDLRHRLCVE